MVTLDDLGPRICIMGPSNSGKSTLAVALARAQGLEAVHLDQLYHLPGTDWRPRPPDEFAALHDAAIEGPGWIIEGNYSRLLPRRLDRATGFVLLDVSTPVALCRYLRRCWFERDRHGALEGGRDRVKWEMIRHIAVATRANRGRYRRVFEDVRLPKVRLASARALARFYGSNGLSRGSPPSSSSSPSGTSDGAAEGGGLRRGEGRDGPVGTRWGGERPSPEP